MRRPLLFASFCLVLAVAWLNCRGRADGFAVPPDGAQVVVTGQIIEKDDNSFEVQILTILKDAASGQQDFSGVSEHFNHSDDTNYSRDLKNKKLIISYEPRELSIGTKVTLRGEFAALAPASNPGEFDYAQYYSSAGYCGRIYDAEILDVCGEPGVGEYLYDLRMLWKGRLYEVFPEREASIMAAILLGEKGDVDEEIRALYERNGIVHILSISGLHITIIGMGLYKLLRKMGLPVWVSAVAGAVVLILYGLLTGFGVSVCRAVGMYLLRMLGLLWGRTYDMLTALGVVGALMVLIHPAWLRHMGFLLSFGSVLGVGLMLPALSGAQKEEILLKRYVEGRIHRALRKIGAFVIGLLKEGVLAGVSITFTTLPIQLWFSYEVSVYSVILNALILPLMSMVMIAGLVAMLVPGMGIVGTADVIILSGYEGLCHVFEGLPASMWNPGRPAVWQMAVYYLLWALVVWGVPWFEGQYKKILNGSQSKKPDEKCKSSAVRRIGQIGCLCMAVGIMAIPRFGGDRVTFLDVGQGDCICVQLSSGEVYLFDCGSSSRKGIGENVLIPFLKYYGISEITAVLASHGDMDHINGLEELLNLAEQSHIRIGQLVLPHMDRMELQEAFGGLIEAAEELKVPVRMIAAGEEWSYREDRFVCLHPIKEGYFQGNAASECFYIELREGKQKLSLLLSGDVEGEGELQLTSRLSEQGIDAVDVLKVAHHGSKNSSSKEFLGQVKPRVSVISCGRQNRYGHPHEETLLRLENVGSTVLATPGYGAITIELDREIMIRGMLSD